MPIQLIASMVALSQADCSVHAGFPFPVEEVSDRRLEIAKWLIKQPQSNLPASRGGFIHAEISIEEAT